MDHPLKVYFPHGGKYFILHWWSYNRRGHIIISKNKEAILKTWEKVIKEYDEELTVKEYSEIQIVAPPNDFCIFAAEKEKQKNINDFLNEVFCFYVYNSRTEFPKCIKKCEKYNPEDADELNDDWNVITHNNCSNCNSSFNLVGISPEEFYNKYQEKWHKEFSTEKYVDKLFVYSRAEQANDNEPLLIAVEEFGHHRDGILIVDGCSLGEECDCLCVPCENAEVKK